MATLMVMQALLGTSLHSRGRGRRGRRRGGKGREIAEYVAGFDEIHAVPLERLLDDQLAAEAFVEAARGLVAGDDPYDHRGGAVPALRLDDGGQQPAAESGALVFAAQIDRRDLGVGP